MTCLNAYDSKVNKRVSGKLSNEALTASLKEVSPWRSLRLPLLIIPICM